MSKEAFIATAWDLAGRKVAKAQLLGDIYETACGSIGLPVPPDAPAVSMFRLVIGEARGLIRQRDAIEAMADTLLSDSSGFTQGYFSAQIIIQREFIFSSLYKSFCFNA